MASKPKREFLAYPKKGHPDTLKEGSKIIAGGERKRKKILLIHPGKRKMGTKENKFGKKEGNVGCHGEETEAFGVLRSELGR
ncbi:hypothetical protein CEXT_36031 [Caerostris extrusa]|uniref:Uncharacterized protein n=1 Tax=Caerostris extrusa TaxID=172846 RepID=A0AAV4MEC8_CAEEX|nr:hypothetical protein CEXT_36031 [Caerostris extrusa]